MSVALNPVRSGRLTFPFGVYPPENKELSVNAPIEVLPTPKRVDIPLLQHTGAPNEPIHIKPNTPVALGDLVGQCDAHVTAPIHASIAGTTTLGAVTTLPNGRHVRCISLKAEGEQLEGRALWEDQFGGDWPVSGLEPYAPVEIVQAIRRAGIVGQGGAAFPSHIKIAAPKEKPVETVLINGCECEPYLTADERLMIEAPEPVISGALLVQIATGAKNVIIGIEDHMPQAFEALRRAAQGTAVEVRTLKTKYPQGGEKQLVLGVLNRVVPTGGLPLDVGVVVVNVGTAAAIARAVLRRKPLTHRVVSVTGKGIRNPKNLLVPVGVSYRNLVDYCGGLTGDAARLVAGGPMMGFTLGSLDSPVTKGTSGLTVLTHGDLIKSQETSCIRCGRCVDVCPLNLVPTKIALAVRAKDWEWAGRFHIKACMECGCCAYICPARIPLVQLIRTGKALLPK
ncbi:MAG: electron transport complex subunit RsxC [Candidatus Omnitrophica bacterium]|nr:electron transport complex subunit RsxC [Candidatus Omnitrophota bacterium]